LFYSLEDGSGNLFDFANENKNLVFDVFVGALQICSPLATITDIYFIFFKYSKLLILINWLYKLYGYMISI